MTEQELREEITEMLLESGITKAADDFVEAFNNFCERLKKERTVWDLKCNDRAYFINTFGYIYEEFFAEEDFEYDAINVGNCFLTEEDAQLELQKRKVEALLEKYGGVPFRKTNHKHDGGNYYYTIMVTYAYPDKYYVVPQTVYFPDGGINLNDVIPFAFKTADHAKSAIQKIGEERLIAYAYGELYENA